MSVPVFDLDAAVSLATTAHAGQTDKAGAAYIGLPLRVMARVAGDDARMVAVLHDVIEDTPVTAADLLALGYPAAVVDAVEALSKRPGETLGEHAEGRRAATRGPRTTMASTWRPCGGLHDQTAR